jgi:hypothetical protein
MEDLASGKTEYAIDARVRELVRHRVRDSFHQLAFG